MKKYLLVMFSLFVPFFSFADFGSGEGCFGYNTGRGMMGSGFGWGYSGMIFNLVFLVLVVVGIVYLVKFLGSSKGGSIENKSSLDILKERYAKGEIKKEEFEQMKKDLE